MCVLPYMAAWDQKFSGYHDTMPWWQVLACEQPKPATLRTYLSSLYELEPTDAAVRHKVYSHGLSGLEAILAPWCYTCKN